MDLQKLLGGLSKSGALSGFMGGVAGGGLTSMVSSKKGRKTGKSAMKVGALAAVGGLAWKAYQQYSASQKEQGSKLPTATRAAQTQSVQSGSGSTFDFRPASIEQRAFEEVVEDDNPSGQMLIMRAMISAANADGHIDDSERSRIFSQVDSMDLTIEEKATLFDELRRPLSLSELISEVPNAQTGIEVYAASASAIDLNEQCSQHYLQQLASQLCIPTELTYNIQQELKQF